jgi:hypothetical protein
MTDQPKYAVDIVDILLKNRPELSVSSVETYRNIFKRIVRTYFDPSEFTEKYAIDHVDHVIEKIGEASPSLQRSFLSIMVHFSSDNEKAQKKYRDAMFDISKKKQEQDDKNKKRETREDWTSIEEIDEILKHLVIRANYLYKKDEMTGNDLQKIQEYVILSILSGKYIPVRRLMDFTNMKVAGDIDKEKDNYMDKNVFVFNKYKTAGKYGRQEVKIPSTLKRIIKKWLEVNPTDYLLFNEKLAPLSETRLNQILHKIFGGRKISVNTLRSVYIDSIYPDDLPNTETLKKIAHDMGHSVNMALNYRTNVKDIKADD